MSFYFYIIFLLIIIQAILVIISKNSVTSVIFLISTYLLTSIFFLLLGSEFLAILLIIVYVGAVSILFIFVVMMLNLRLVEVYNTLVTYLPIGSFLGLFFMLETLYIIKTDLNIFSIYYLDNYSLSWGFDLSAKSNLNLMSEVLFIIIIIFYDLRGLFYY